MLNDLRSDLEGGVSKTEMAFVVEALARQSAELLLAGRRRWLGQGKWLARALEESEEGLAERFSGALGKAHGGDVARLLELTEATLAAAGGSIDAEWTAVAPGIGLDRGS